MNNLDEALAKFLRKECTEEELKEVNDWLKESDENAQHFFEWEEAFYIGKQVQKEDQEKLAKAEAALFNRIEREKKKVSKRYTLSRIMQYAAIGIGVILTVALSYSSYKEKQEVNNLVTIVSGNSIRELHLDDGTKVWLNKNTTFTYSVHYAKRERTVYLNGEAYFEVRKNSEMPFVVQSEAMQVRVLGTTFNLKSQKESSSAVATLLEGEIEVKGNNNEGLIVLLPGQVAELNGLTKQLLLKQAGAGIDKWNTNEFVFNQAKITDIARALAEFYQVKIHLASDIDAENTYSGVLKKKERVEDMLLLMTYSIPVNYKVVGDSILLSSKE
ncbi:MAG: FecR family protein [Phocaeicola sp.]